MKKILLLLIIVSLSLATRAQVFNTGQTLGRGDFAVGINPAVHVQGPSNGLNLYLHGGFGLKSGIDIGIKFGIGNQTYFGADVEWGLTRNISLTTGLHTFGDFGLDGTLNLTLPLRSDVRLYSGLDFDIVFADQVAFPFWVPVAVEIGLRSNLSFILEGNIGLNDDAYHIINGGVNIYF
jgi:hypothetical protein